VDKVRNCVACGKEFNENDDIVVCPDCGAPHHRTCWQAEGQCHFHEAHGTDREWSPAPPQEETPPPTEETTTADTKPQQLFFINGLAMTKCPACGKITRVYPSQTTCNHCGHPIDGIPSLGTPLEQAAPFGKPDWKMQEPIDGVETKKLARMVVQRADYYIPRFRTLKKQGNRVVSWNWAAFLLAPYWLAYRKCYLWAIFALFFDLLSTVFLVPAYQELAPFLAEGYQAYMQSLPQIATEISFATVMTIQVGLLILVARGILFGLLGNYIYKKECMRRIERLDAMSPAEANVMAFRLGGVNIFLPIILYYLTNLLENLILTLLT
ncbi:MAG: DUF2628 domain-containing protein, partial [Clostridia bacterium]|nr:DUF2628 domain-containing protein [Clostridia bacterium]